MKRCFVLSIILFCALAAPGAAYAQSTPGYAAATQWGTAPASIAVPGASDSASTHVLNGSIAGNVNAARRGLLIDSGGSMTIEAIGSQTIVSSTIYGNGNSASINATQSSSNTGAVTDNGQFARTISSITNGN